MVRTENNGFYKVWDKFMIRYDKKNYNIIQFTALGES